MSVEGIIITMLFLPKCEMWIHFHFHNLYITKCTSTKASKYISNKSRTIAKNSAKLGMLGNN